MNNSCNNHDQITIMLSYTSNCGDTITRTETVNIRDDFPHPMDAVSLAAESFLKDIGAIHTNTVYFVDELTEGEYEAVTDVLMELRKNDDCAEVNK